MSDVAIYIEDVKPGKTRRLVTLHSAEVEIRHCRTGSRDYLKAEVECRMHSAFARDVLYNKFGNLWIAWQKGRWSRREFIRVQSMHWDLGVMRFHCDQSREVGLAHIGGKFRHLRVVEPSPPVPSEEWWEAERSRAINDYVLENGGEVNEIFEMYRR